MTVYDLLKHYVGNLVELSNGEDVEFVNRGMAMELYDDTVVDYFYITDDDMGSYLTIITKEE
jgi:hypothetical protein